MHVAPRDANVYFDIENVLAGKHTSGPRVMAICGEDNRVLHEDKAVGRLFTNYNNPPEVNGTAWIVSTGVYVTAGHVIYGWTRGYMDDEVLEFNVKPTLADGTPQHADTRDQYTIKRIIDYQYSTTDPNNSDDWGVFEVNNNSETGLQPIQAQQKSFQVSQSHGSVLRVTGYGVAPGARNNMEQSDSGPFSNSSGNLVYYRIDTDGDCSGSPIIDDATGVAVGVHTNDGCSSDPSSTNHGTSLANSRFWAVLQPKPISATVDQLFSDNSRVSASVGRWNGSTFGTVPGAAHYSYHGDSRSLLWRPDNSYRPKQQY